MAINTGDRTFRNLVINDTVMVEFKTDHLYDPDNSFSKANIESLQQNGDSIGAACDAFKQINENKFPLDVDARNEAVKAAIECMCQVKRANDIIKVLTEFQDNMKDLDNIMMLCYKGLETNNKLNDAKTLFIWHKEIHKLGGVGTILRVINDKRDL